MAGYLKATQESGLAVLSEFIRHGDFHLEAGYRCGEAMMRLNMPPTAIFSCPGLVHALSKLKIECSSAVSIIGFDDADSSCSRWALVARIYSDAT